MKIAKVRWLVLLLPAFSACTGEPEATNHADLVLLGGHVETLDSGIGPVEALAIVDYRIAAVGTNDEIAALIGPDTDVIELNGRFAMPGFIEGHGHFLGIGEARQQLDLTRASSWDDIVSMVSIAADKAGKGEWILGRGWHQDKWAAVPEDAVDGVPRHDELSAVSPDNPVFLVHASGHASMANEVALRAAGIEKASPDPAGGTIVRSPDGTATGLLRETAQGLVRRLVTEYESRMTPAEREAVMRERVQLATAAALELGVTSFQDAGCSFSDIDFLRQLEEEGELGVRLYVMVRGESNERMAELLPHYRMIAEDNDFLAVRAIKRAADGALGTHGAWLLEPYEDLPESSGLAVESLDDIARTASLAVEHGFQLATHAIGDRANRETLDLYKRTWEQAGADGGPLRWRIEHSQHIDPADVPRFAALGVIAAMQGVHSTSDGPWIPARLGEERAEATSYVWRKLIDSGALVTNGTDAPVESLDPIASFYSSVSRKMSNGERFYPHQAMSRMEALKSYTLNNAIAAFEEHIKGSLTPGKLADIVVLSDNVLEIDEDKIPSVRVEMTIVGGRLRYAAK